MSEVFLGIVVRGIVPAVAEVLTDDPLNNILVATRFSDDFLIVWVKNPPAATRISDGEFDRLSRELSRRFSSSLYLNYDSRLGYRESQLYEKGDSRLGFGLDDELWVPLREDGELDRSAPPMKVSELQEDEEYGTIKNAIDFGFESFGGGSWSGLKSFISQCHCCK